MGWARLKIGLTLCDEIAKFEIYILYVSMSVSDPESFKSFEFKLSTARPPTLNPVQNEILTLT